MIALVDLGPFFGDPDGFSLGWEWGNPLAYFNLAGFVLAILILRRLRDRNDDSPLARGVHAGAWVFAIGTGLHFLGDLTNVSELWDHQFIHFVVLVALAVLFFRMRSDEFPMPVGAAPAAPKVATPPAKAARSPQPAKPSPRKAKGSK